MATLAPSFFIRSSFLQVTRTTIKTGQCSNFDQIRQTTAELVPLSVSKKPDRLIMGEMLWPL